jgi:DoxX-like family
MPTTIASASQDFENAGSKRRHKINIVLWVLQILLAGLFLFAGAIKLVLPIEAMTKQLALPGAFLRFIGVAETLGALGLVLPWSLRIRRELTPLAAVGLLIIMTGATILTVKMNGVAAALVPFAVGIFALIIAYGRWTFLRNPRP